MRWIRVVQWRYNGVWENSAAFVEPREAEIHASELKNEFPMDDVRIVKMQVSFHEQTAEVLPS